MLDIIPSHATSSRCYVRLGCEFDVMVHSTGKSAQSLRLGRRYRVPGKKCYCDKQWYEQSHKQFQWIEEKLPSEVECFWHRFPFEIHKNLKEFWCPLLNGLCLEGEKICEIYWISLNICKQNRNEIIYIVRKWHVNSCDSMIFRIIGFISTLLLLN